MSIVSIIKFISIVVWIFPAIRQYKNRYFYFFLILASLDFIMIVFRAINHSGSNLPIIFFICLMIVSLVQKDKIKQVLLWIVPIYIIVSIAALYLNDRYFELYVSMILTIVIFYIFVRTFFNHAIIHQEINLFLLMLVFYMALNIFKKLNILIAAYEGAFFYYSTYAFQLLIGIFFSIYSFNNPKLNIKIASKKEI